MSNPFIPTFRKAVVVADHYRLSVMRLVSEDCENEQITGTATKLEWSGAVTDADVERDVSRAIAFPVRVERKTDSPERVHYTLMREEPMTTATKRKGGTNGDAASTPDLAGIEMSLHTPAPPVITLTDHPGFFHLKIDKIERWQGNPRKKFNDEDLAELATSIKARGVLQPILVRPLTTCNPRDMSAAALDAGATSEVIPYRYLIVAGERRWRAAALAGQKDVPCIVREMSDKEALEIAVIENEQRKDVGPMEKADGYRRLVQEHGVSVEELAGRVGKSVSTIRGLLKLMILPEKARKAVEAGELPASTAELIARVPTAFHRERVTEAVVQGIFWNNPETFNDPKVKIKDQWGPKNQGPLSYRETKELIGRCCMIELKQAPFSRKAPDINGAPSCEECPKRVGNLQKTDPAGYEGVRADVCTDPECFRGKCSAFSSKMLADAEVKGQKVLGKKESDKLWNYDGKHLDYHSGYVDLAEQCHEVPKNPSYKQLLEKHIEEKQIVIACDKQGQVHRLIPLELAQPILKKEHGIGKKAAASRSSSEYEARFKKEQADYRKKQIFEKEVGRRCMDIVAEKAEEIAAHLTQDSNDSRAYQQIVALFNHLAVGVTQLAWDEAARLVIVRRGLEKEKGTGGNTDVVENYAQTLSFSGSVGLIAELIAGRRAGGMFHHQDKEEKAFWEFFGVDRKAVEKQARAEGSAKNGKVAAGKKVQTMSAQSNGTNGHAKKKRGRCSKCGCTEEDCSQCIAKTGRPCCWMDSSETLCSACVDEVADV